jgi:hypothetical protein
MRTVDVFEGRLVVTPDNATAGSEGRVYLLLPEEMNQFVGRLYRPLGNLGRDGYLMMVESAEGKTVTPKRQIWWKNGVREYGIRQNHHVKFWILGLEVWVVQLMGYTDDPVPDLPPYQQLLFGS